MPGARRSGSGMGTGKKISWERVFPKTEGSSYEKGGGDRPRILLRKKIDRRTGALPNLWKTIYHGFNQSKEDGGTRWAKGRKKIGSRKVEKLGGGESRNGAYVRMWESKQKANREFCGGRAVCKLKYMVFMEVALQIPVMEMQKVVAGPGRW